MKKSFLILVTAIMFVLAGCGSKPTLSEWVNGVYRQRNVCVCKHHCRHLC